MKFGSLVVSLILGSSAIYAKTQCLDPFEARSKDFLLQESLECNQNLKSVDLFIKNATDSSISTLNSSGYYLQAECVDNYKVMDLYYGSEIVAWSERMNGNENTFKVNLTCEPKTLGILNFNSEKMLLPQGMSTVSIRVLHDDASQSLEAYVLQSEDLPNAVTVRLLDGSVAMTAQKTFYTDSTCYANWVVDNKNLDPYIASYILGWKDNRDLSCVPIKKLTALEGASIAAGTLFFVGTLIGVYICVKWPEIQRRRASYQIQNTETP